MKRLLRSTALGLALGFFLPAPEPGVIFVWSVKALAASPDGIAPPVLPNWISDSCCGPQDVHTTARFQGQRPDQMLTLDQIHGPMERAQGYHMLGNTELETEAAAEDKTTSFPVWIIGEYHHLVADSEKRPSQDGNYWLFYRQDPDGSQTGIYCFFVPLAF